jgi:site-specific recombinase XerC
VPLPAPEQTVADYLGMRDRALLLFGFAGGFRRSELVGLDYGDLQFSSAGVAVTLRRVKNDQEGASRRTGIPYGLAPRYGLSCR